MILVTLKSSADATVSFTADYDLRDLKSYGIQAVFTGTDVAGTFKLQKSIDGVNFADITGKSTSVTTSTTAVQDDEANYRFVRASWTYTSGTGRIVVSLAVKEQPPLLTN